MAALARPFGTWPSPLSAHKAASGAPRFAGLALSRGTDGSVIVWWSALVGGSYGVFRSTTGTGDTAVPQVRSARSRVNEYGGGAFWVHGETLFWVEDDDQCIRRLAPGDEEPVLLTNPGPSARNRRYAAGVVDPTGRWMVVEREVHSSGAPDADSEPANDLAWLRTDPGASGGEAAPLVGGADFCAAPALSPDGRHLAWLRWDHPAMPWDAAELWAAELHFDEALGLSVGNQRRVAGGPVGAGSTGGRPVAACLPRWSPEGRLWWCDDREDLWLLRSAPSVGLPEPDSGANAAAVHPGRGEVGEPRWVSGGSRYGFGDGFVDLAETVDGMDQVVGLEINDAGGSTTSGSRRSVPEQLASVSWIDSLVVDGDTTAVVAGFPSEPTSVVVSGPEATVHHHSGTFPLPLPSISRPESISYVTGPGSGGVRNGGNVAHGLFHAPRLQGYEGPPGDLPPLLVRIHGGPTAHARAELTPSVQFWTSRGFAVVEVNYRGSTGFGRAYRDLLRGGWGLVEVQDCIAAAEYLVAEGRVDPARCVIRGGSAGGFTALEAVSAPPTEAGFRFAAATTLYGVTDLEALVLDTHKFESRYLDGLVGPYPQDRDVYRDRSPLYHPERISAPVLVLQGLDDPIVPPGQAEVLVEALEVAGVDHEYRAYEGEGHGFRMTSTLVDTLEAELAFYQRVLGLVDTAGH